MSLTEALPVASIVPVGFVGRTTRGRRWEQQPDRSGRDVVRSTPLHALGGATPSASQVASRLIEAFGEVRGTPRVAVMCVSEDFLLCNSTAESELTDDERELLLGLVRATISNGGVTATLRAVDSILPGETVVRVIEMDGQAIGARVEVAFGHSEQRGADPLVLAPSSSVATSGALERTRESALTRLADGGFALLAGAPGVGKRTLGRALLGEGCVEIDLAAEEAAAPGAGVALVERALRGRPTGLLLGHVQLLVAADRDALADVLRRRPAITRVVATLGADDSAGTSVFGPALRVPDLQERREEIPGLIAMFTAQVSDRSVVWMPAALKVLEEAQWDDNIRTLRAVVSQVARDTSGYIGVGNLPAWLRTPTHSRQMSALERSEASIIREALDATSWNKLQAAERLGMARSTLYRRMRALKIQDIAR